jgi:hypothetical protein
MGRTSGDVGSWTWCWARREATPTPRRHPAGFVVPRYSTKPHFDPRFLARSRDTSQTHATPIATHERLEIPGVEACFGRFPHYLLKRSSPRNAEKPPRPTAASKSRPRGREEVHVNRSAHLHVSVSLWSLPRVRVSGPCARSARQSRALRLLAGPRVPGSDPDRSRTRTRNRLRTGRQPGRRISRVSFLRKRQATRESGPRIRSATGVTALAPTSETRTVDFDSAGRVGRTDVKSPPHRVRVGVLQILTGLCERGWARELPSIGYDGTAMPEEAPTCNRS